MEKLQLHVRRGRIGRGVCAAGAIPGDSRQPLPKGQGNLPDRCKGTWCLQQPWGRGQQEPGEIQPTREASGSIYKTYAVILLKK